MWGRKRKPTPTEVELQQAEKERDAILSEGVDAIADVDALHAEVREEKDALLRQYQQAGER